MEAVLRHGSIALFRHRKRPMRGDIVLVDHPELGRIVRKVSAVGRQGNVHLTVTSRGISAEERGGRVPREAVLGVFVRRLGRIALPLSRA